jgi:hypothetical protein
MFMGVPIKWPFWKLKPGNSEITVASCEAYLLKVKVTHFFQLMSFYEWNMGKMLLIPCL